MERKEGRREGCTHARTHPHNTHPHNTQTHTPTPTHARTHRYVPDYYYTYRAKYAPDARAIARWVEDEEFDPFPDLELPLSDRPALSPLEACLALMPASGGAYVPRPLRPLLEAKGSALQALLNSADLRPLEPSDISRLVAGVDLGRDPMTPEEEAAN